MKTTKTTKTTNWQTKALTFFIAAATLWLTTACGEHSVAEYTVGDRIAPSSPCGPDVPLTTAEEFRDLPAREALDDGAIDTINWNQANAERWKRIRPEVDRIEAMLANYIDHILLRHEHQTQNLRQSRIRQSTREYFAQLAPSYQVSALRNEKGLPTDKLVIEIYVNDFVDQSTLPPEDRLPECLEGVEVHYILQGGEIIFLNER